MYIADQCDEILHIIDRLTLETILEKMSYALVPLIIIDGVRYGYGLHDRAYVFLCFPDKQMHMVGHQAIGIDQAGRREWQPSLVCGVDSMMEQLDELEIVVRIIKDILPINTSKHHVIDACSAVSS